MIRLEVETSHLRGDVTELQNNVNQLQKDVNQLRVDVAEIKEYQRIMLERTGNTGVSQKTGFGTADAIPEHRVATTPVVPQYDPQEENGGEQVKAEDASLWLP